MKFRPCIDLHEGKVKQIVGETLGRDNTLENFVSEHDSAYFAELYKFHGLTGGHIIMLGPGNSEEAKNALRVFPGGFQVGGGLNDENFYEFLDAGASHIIITSFIFTDGKLDIERVKRASEKIGKQRLVLDLSCKSYKESYYVATNKWRDITDFEISDSSLSMLAGYCDEFLIHASDVEGKRGGPDLKLISMLSKYSDIPVTYAGGVSNAEDVREVYRHGNGKIDLTIGSALDIFGGDIEFENIIHMDEFKLNSN